MTMKMVSRFVPAVVKQRLPPQLILLLLYLLWRKWHTVLLPWLQPLLFLSFLCYNESFLLFLKGISYLLLHWSYKQCAKRYHVKEVIILLMFYVKCSFFFLCAPVDDDNLLFFFRNYLSHNCAYLLIVLLCVLKFIIKLLKYFILSYFKKVGFAVNGLIRRPHGFVPNHSSVKTLICQVDPPTGLDF